MAPHLVFVKYPNSLKGEGVVNLDDTAVSLLAYPLTGDGLLSTTEQPVTLFNQPDPPMCETYNIYAVPNGRFLIVQYNCEADLFIRLFDLANETATSAVLPRGYFLDWSSDGNSFLFRQIDLDEVWLVSADGQQDATPTALNLPPRTYQAVFTPDGQQITYVSGHGLGQGSELGSLNLRDGSMTVQQQFPDQVVATPKWSPDGKQLAYILMPDDNTPYKAGELWLADANAQPVALLAQADAGHGYSPVWSPDGQNLTYIQRENPDVIAADHNPYALHSNIYQVEPSSGKITPLTQFNQTLVADMVWSPDGHQLAFTAGDAIWLLTPGEPPVQVSQDGIARHPAWVNAPTQTE